MVPVVLVGVDCVAGCLVVAVPVGPWVGWGTGHHHRRRPDDSGHRLCPDFGLALGPDLAGYGPCAGPGWNTFPGVGHPDPGLGPDHHCVLAEARRGSRQDWKVVGNLEILGVVGLTQRLG